MEATAGTDKAKAVTALNNQLGNVVQRIYAKTGISKYRYAGNRIHTN